MNVSSFASANVRCGAREAYLGALSGAVTVSSKVCDFADVSVVMRATSQLERQYAAAELKQRAKLHVTPGSSAAAAIAHVLRSVSSSGVLSVEASESALWREAESAVSVFLSEQCSREVAEVRGSPAFKATAVTSHLVAWQAALCWISDEAEDGGVVLRPPSDIVERCLFAFAADASRHTSEFTQSSAMPPYVMFLYCGQLWWLLTTIGSVALTVSDQDKTHLLERVKLMLLQCLDVAGKSMVEDVQCFALAWRGAASRGPLVSKLRTAVQVLESSVDSWGSVELLTSLKRAIVDGSLEPLTAKAMRMVECNATSPSELQALDQLTRDVVALVGKANAQNMPTLVTLERLLSSRLSS